MSLKHSENFNSLLKNDEPILSQIDGLDPNNKGQLLLTDPNKTIN